MCTCAQIRIGAMDCLGPPSRVLQSRCRAASSQPWSVPKHAWPVHVLADTFVSKSLGRSHASHCHGPFVDIQQIQTFERDCMLGMEWLLGRRCLAPQAVLAFVLGFAVEAVAAKPAMGALIGGPLKGPGRPNAAGTLSELLHWPCSSKPLTWRRFNSPVEALSLSGSF
jgi:hypothetical protein